MARAAAPIQPVSVLGMARLCGAAGMTQHTIDMLRDMLAQFILTLLGLA